MQLSLVGLSYRTAPIAVREKLAFTESGLPAALTTLQQEYGFEEGLILSTCNRVEVMGRADVSDHCSERIRSFLCDYHQLSIEAFGSYLYELSSRPLVQHVFRVASSLDAMVVGEAQILGQVKRAYSESCEAGLAGSHLNGLLSHAFFTAKRVRTQTQVGHTSVSVSSVAVDLARRIFPRLEGTTVLLLGAGEMSELAARSMVSAGSKVLVANRTPQRASTLAESLGGAAVPYAELAKYLPGSDVVLVSTGADSFVLTPELVKNALRRRRSEPIFIIDISVPRNVDPAINEVDNAFLYDIDDLESVVHQNQQGRLGEAEQAEAIIDDEVKKFVEMGRRQDLGSQIAELRATIEALCLAELDNYPEELDTAEYERVRRALLRAAHQVAHPLILELKRGNADDPNRLQLRRLLEQVLPPESNPK